jgi:hypothetical protein
VLRFAPLPARAPRAIDVCNIGRRSEVTHRALLRLARERGLFYYYDTVAASGGSGKQRTFRVDDPLEHRLLLASVLKRSRYFLANRGRINEPEFTRGHDEIAGRFYEGAAAGTVMLGEPPRTPEFEQQFGWKDAVIPAPFDSPEIGDLLACLDREPERLARIRRDNVAHAARRHDWVHRLRARSTRWASHPLTRCWRASAGCSWSRSERFESLPKRGRSFHFWVAACPHVSAPRAQAWARLLQSSGSATSVGELA